MISARKSNRHNYMCIFAAETFKWIKPCMLKTEQSYYSDKNALVKMLPIQRGLFHRRGC